MKYLNGNCLYVAAFPEIPATYKIGITDCLDKRLLQLSQTMPFRVELIHAVYTRYAGLLEIHLHMRFGKKRLRGEWFSLNTRDLNYIRFEAEDVALDFVARVNPAPREVSAESQS